MTTDSAFTVEKDGAISIPVEGKPVRYVRESDLLAVKGGAETSKGQYESQLTKLTNDLAEVGKQRDTHAQLVLQHQARIEKLQEMEKEHATFKAKVGEQQQTIDAATKSRGELETELTGYKKSILIDQYKVDKDKVEKMSLAELREAEKTLSILGIKPAARANYDAHGGNSGNQGPEAPLDRAKRIIDAHEQKHGRMAVASTQAK